MHGALQQAGYTFVAVATNAFDPRNTVISHINKPVVKHNQHLLSASEVDRNISILIILEVPFKRNNWNQQCTKYWR
jgi:hypothetical protein